MNTALGSGMNAHSVRSSGLLNVSADVLVFLGSLALASALIVAAALIAPVAVAVFALAGAAGLVRGPGRWRAAKAL